MQQEIVFSGFGGQGALFAGQVLAYAAMDEGLNVTWIPSYGPEMRGGTAHCTVVVSDKIIGSPVVSRPSIAAVFNLPSFERYEPLVSASGLLVVNTSLVTQHSSRTDIDIVYVPASDTANELGNSRLANMIVLGALLTQRPLVSIEAAKKALTEHIADRHRDTLDLNYRAIEMGVEMATNPV
jgi:2-oxoglutarate ferredoxin oxidoreductase subunit gamma